MAQLLIFDLSIRAELINASKNNIVLSFTKNLIIISNMKYPLNTILNMPKFSSKPQIALVLK